MGARSPHKKRRTRSVPRKGEQTEKGNHPVDGSPKRLCGLRDAGQGFLPAAERRGGSIVLTVLRDTPNGVSLNYTFQGRCAVLFILRPRRARLVLLWAGYLHGGLSFSLFAAVLPSCQTRSVRWIYTLSGRKTIVTPPRLAIIASPSLSGSKAEPTPYWNGVISSGFPAIISRHRAIISSIVRRVTGL